MIRRLIGIVNDRLPGSLFARGSLRLLVGTAVAVPIYNLLVVMPDRSIFDWFKVPLCVVFALCAALTSIPAGASLRHNLDQETRLHRAVGTYFLFLALFIFQALAFPALEATWESSQPTFIAAGTLVAVEALVLSYLKKIAWDRAVKLTGDSVAHG